MFGTDYLELLGFPADGEIKRPELAAAPLGLNGLVFKTQDVDKTFAHLQSLGVAGDPPKSFSRPVTLANGETRDAKFRTVALAPDAFPAGRFYFCEHITPELVWRPEWQSHGNGAARFNDITVVSESAAETAELVAKIIHSDVRAGTNVSAADGFCLHFQTPADYAARFGDVARGMAGRTAVLGAVTIKSRSTGELRARIESDDRFAVTSLRVLVKAFDAVVAFAD